MKRNFTIIFCFCFTVAQSQSKFHLIGEISGFENKHLKLSYKNAESKYLTDSARIMDGKFEFSGSIKEPTVAVLQLDVLNPHNQESNSLTFWLEPVSMNITYNNSDFFSPTIAGSRTQNKFDSLETVKKDISATVSRIHREYMSILDSLKIDTGDIRLKDAANKKRDWILYYNDQMAEIDLRYIKEHPNSYISPYFLFYDMAGMDPDSVVSLFQTFPNNIKNSDYGISIQEQLVGYPGRVAQDFNAQDLQGNTFHLYSLKGTYYILLDFWASWCVPCRASRKVLFKGS